MDDEVLIECVREHSCLFDMADPKYLDTIFKSSVWRRIGEKIKQSDENCKKRWTNIKDQFKKFLNKRKTKSGQSAKVMKKYKYEDTLQFLIPYIQDRDTISSIGDVDESENANNQAEREEETGVDEIEISPITSNLQPTDPPSETPNSFPSTSSGQTSSLSTSRTHRKRAQYRNLSTMTQVPQNSASNTLMKYLIEKKDKTKDEIHPIDAFFQGLIPTVKRFSSYYQHLAKGQIFSVVQQLEYEQLRPTDTNYQVLTSPHESSTNSTSTGEQFSLNTGPLNEVPETTKNGVGSLFSQFSVDEN